MLQESYRPGEAASAVTRERVETIVLTSRCGTASNRFDHDVALGLVDAHGHVEAAVVQLLVAALRHCDAAS